MTETDAQDRRKVVRLQMAPEIDSITDDLHVGSRLPYPFFADAKGMVQQQDFWQGKVYKVIGFQKDLAVMRIDLWWEAAYAEPEKIIGKYLVTSDDQGNWGVFPTAVTEIDVQEWKAD